MNNMKNHVTVVGDRFGEEAIELLKIKVESIIDQNIFTSYDNYKL